VQAILLNIRHGGGRRAQSLLEWTISRSHDVIVMPEWREGASGEIFRTGLTAANFKVATASFSKTSNGVLLAAKSSFHSRCLTPAGAQKGALLLADLASGCRLLAAYFPQGKVKSSFFEICIKEALAADDMPFILLGDLNTGQNKVDVEGNGVPFQCADLFAALQTKAGLIDLWRNEHPDKREWSWRSPINGFRVDHALANEAFRKHFPAIKCSYDHTPRERSLTDHSALVLMSHAQRRN
jgi:exonuclease III